MSMRLMTWLQWLTKSDDTVASFKQLSEQFNAAEAKAAGKPTARTWLHITDEDLDAARAHIQNKNTEANTNMWWRSFTEYLHERQEKADPLAKSLEDLNVHLQRYFLGLTRWQGVPFQKHQQRLGRD
ncbi:hypothetical protein HK102_001766 [Quaeritorhiza haematococci]|nr:hypothetical protein HK102_001766 [Quaeritorhiza haematococci]